MKILYLTKFIVDQHGFSRSFELAKGLVMQGHQVIFIAASPCFRGSEEWRDGVHIITFNDPMPSSVKKGGLSLIDVVQRMWFGMRQDIDLIMVDSGFRPVTGLVGHWLAWWKRIPYVCEWWDWIGKRGLYDRKSTLYRYSLGLLDHYFELWDKRHADGVVALSQVLHQRAINLGLKEEQVCIIHGGCDSIGIPAQATTKSRQHWRQSFGLPANAVVIGFAGLDAHEVMDIHPFLEAMKKIRKQHLSVYWFSTGGHLSDYIRRMYTIDKEYRELGWVDYRAYSLALCNADILILTQEEHLINKARWPNKLGDYLASGNPVLLTAVGEVVCFAKNNPENGLHFVDWTVESILQGLYTLINNSQQRKIMGMSNRKLAEDTLSWQSKATELHHFLLQIERQTLNKRK